VVWAGDQLPEIDAVAPALLDAVIAYLEDGNARAAAGLSREPGVGDVRIEVTKTRKDDSRGRPRIDSSGAGFAKNVEPRTRLAGRRRGTRAGGRC
jgi:hypothetical protein